MCMFKKMMKSNTDHEMNLIVDDKAPKEAGGHWDDV